MNLTLEEITTNLKRWAIAESEGHPQASRWVDYYDKLFFAQSKLEKERKIMPKKITRIDLITNPNRILFQRDEDIETMQIYHPTRASWERLARALHNDASAWRIRANWFEPGLVAERKEN